MRHVQKILLSLLLMAVAGTVLSPVAQAAATREYALKAAYLYKFLNLIQWPEESSLNSFVIGVVGPEPFGDSLEDLTSKMVRGKPVRVETFPMVTQPAPSEQMILFIDRQNDEHLARVLEDLQGRYVLTVGEGPRFAERGGCINLVTVKNRIRFRINVDAVRRAHLRISPRLVKVASLLITDRGKKASYEEYQDILAVGL